MLQNGQFMTVTEMEGAKHVLHAAAMTYIAAFLMALAELLRMIILKESLEIADVLYHKGLSSGQFSPFIFYSKDTVRN